MKEEFLVANVTDMVFSMDENGKFVAVNPAAEALTGFVPKELVNCHYAKVVLADDLPVVEKQLRTIKSSKGTTYFEARLCSRDGQHSLCLWSACWSESEHSMFCIVHDIGERRKAEESIRISERKIRTIIENMPAALLIMIEGGILENCNPG